jgi:hypothetical protein
MILIATKLARARLVTGFPLGETERPSVCGSDDTSAELDLAPDRRQCARLRILGAITFCESCAPTCRFALLPDRRWRLTPVNSSSASLDRVRTHLGQEQSERACAQAWRSAPARMSLASVLVAETSPERSMLVAGDNQALGLASGKPSQATFPRDISARHAPR